MLRIFVTSSQNLSANNGAATSEQRTDFGFRLRTNHDFMHNHYLGGRYENLYVAFESIPEIRVILDLATAQAAHILNRPKKDLRMGWWLNIMRPGDITFAHTHDADDEILSGVYYIDVPPDSGKLVLIDGVRREEVRPHAGMFIFFAPEILHEVTRNESGRPRISVGFNIGPAKAP